ncbi:unnamed protein product [Microthlaspi erraticum]|uniref:Peptidase C1A papain C-terminal domain-containing protein n=1 Tax=Microthlaspi erraticum TaxID=1685480 RepID=A0A6D2JDG7_9BRAS|nr:unnamed protein product [Microthlaspi erraticum]
MDVGGVTAKQMDGVGDDPDDASDDAYDDASDDAYDDASDDASYGGGGGGKKDQKKKKIKPKPVQIETISPWDDKFPKDLPKGTKTTDFDWSDSDIGEVIREVMDQGNRRTCWTAATTRSFSASLVIQKRFDPPLWLSALHLLVGLIDKVDSKGGLKKLEDLRKFMIDHGTILEEDCSCPQMALEDKNNKSRPDPVPCTDKDKTENIRKFKVEDLVILDEVDEKELMRLVIKGPVAVGIEVYQDFLDFKGDGIYTGLETIGDSLDKHLFLLKGYGTTMPDKDHYWKVQNSAGTKWGDKGNGKIMRQTSSGASSSIFTCVVYPKLLDYYEGQNEAV